MYELSNPRDRLSSEELADLEVVIQQELHEDTRLALEKNFPPEQLQPWEQVREGLHHGWLSLHELRSKSTQTLLSARLMVIYPARKRSELVFILVAWVVTPDSGNFEGREKRQGKGKGYGSYLRGLSAEISRQQFPHALGLVAEREAPPAGAASSEQRVKRASWMTRIGLYRIEDFDYEIPPLVSVEQYGDEYIPVASRARAFQKANLLLSRFDGDTQISGKHVHSMVERIYEAGYGIDASDPYMQERLALIDQNKIYNLVQG